MEIKKKYPSDCLEMKRAYQNKYMNTHPWYRTLTHIKRRCLYGAYLSKGIKCLISLPELKELWFRDKAYLMKRPSIDRKDNNDHYVFDNCRYIELHENFISKGFSKTRKLSKDDVLRMRKIFQNKEMNYAQIGRMFKIDESTAKRAIDKVTWRHI